MDSIGSPRGLIRYDSEQNIASPTPHKPHLDWKRPKVLGYAAALLVASLILGYNIGSRNDTDANVQQIRQPLFIVLSDGSVRNRYQINIGNRTDNDQRYELKVQGIPAKSLDIGNIPEIRVRAGKTLSLNVKVDLSADIARNTKEFFFVIIPTIADAEPVVIKTHFNGQ